MEYKEALNKAAALCSAAEKCEWDIREKLCVWEISDSEADKIITYLKKENFLDENRFAAFFVKDKFRFNKWGRIKIAYVLKMKHISNDIIQEAMLAIDDEEYFSTLCDILQSKQKGLKYKDEYDRRAKLTRFAQSRGFEYEIISRAVR